MPHLNAVAWDAAVLAELADPKYAAMPDDAARAEALNAKTVGAPRVFTMREVRAIAQAAGEWPNVQLQAEVRPATPSVRAALNALATHDDQRFDPSDARAIDIFQAGLALLLAEDVLSQSTVDAIGALATENIPWWRSIGAPAPLNEYDIARVES